MKHIFKNIFSTDKNVLIFTILDLFVLGFNSIVVVPVLVKILPKEILSDYTLYMVYNTIFIVVFQFGLISSFSRYFFFKDDRKITKQLIYSIHFVLSIFALFALTIIFFLLKKHNFFTYFGSIAVSFLSFYVSLEIVYYRLVDKIKYHYLLQIINMISYVLLLFIFSLFTKVTFPLIVNINIFTGFIFASLIIIKKEKFESLIHIKKIKKIFIKETLSFYILNIIFSLITRSLPLFLESKIDDKFYLTQLNISLIYSSLSFVLVASFNKFSLVKYFNSDDYDNKLKKYFLIYHSVSSIFFLLIFKLFFNLFFNKQFIHIWKFFSIFFICNYIWNLSLLENMNLQRKLNVNLIRNFYVFIFIIFIITLLLQNIFLFNLKNIFHLQFVISIIYFLLNYFHGRNENESLSSRFFTFFLFLIGVFAYGAFIKDI